MKCAIIIAADIKQIMFTPENDSERRALKMITPDDDISLDIKEGTLFDSPPSSARGYTVQKCEGGFLRAYESEESLMIVLRPKIKDGVKEPDPSTTIDNYPEKPAFLRKIMD